MTDAADALRVAEAVVDVLAGRRPAAALATVTGRSGSAPQVLGARMLLWREGGEEHSLGTVGGGAIEARVMEACRRTLSTGRADTLSANLIRDLGMCCGGSMEVLVEYLQAAPRLFVIGAGHVAQALAPVMRSVGYRVTVLDDRSELLALEAFAGCERGSFDADELDDALGEAEPNDHFLIVTRDHLRDERALAALLERPHAYLGMIGSQRKVHRVLSRVLRRYSERDRPAPPIDRLRAPVGLGLGGRTPAEIAVSIAAEILALRHGGDGRPMSISEAVAAKLTSPARTG